MQFLCKLCNLCKRGKIMNNKRFYNFIVVIYEDDEDFKQQYANLTINFRSIWIRHDKDVDEEGNDKKPHYHFIVKLKNAKTISSFAKDILVSPNMIEPVKKSFDGSLRYLVHFGYDDKYQYDPLEVKSFDDKLLNRFNKCLNLEISEEDKVESIEEFIHNSGNYVEMNHLGAYVRKIGKWDAFRRNMTYFKIILEEHNAKFIKYR